MKIMNIFKIFRIFDKRPKKGDIITKFIGEGCQGVGKFDFVGKVIGYEYNKNLSCKELVIKIIKRDYSYNDSRSGNIGIYTYPIKSTDLQLVDGTWILFT